MTGQEDLQRVMRTVPIDNIEEATIIEDKLAIRFKDGTSYVLPANGTKLVAGYKNENDIPLNDHCI